MCKMFLGKNAHGIVKYNYVINAAFLGAFAFVVDDACLRKIVVMIVRFYNAIRNINILAIHKKGFIQQSCFIKRSLAYKHKST